MNYGTSELILYVVKFTNNNYHIIFKDTQEIANYIEDTIQFDDYDVAEAYTLPLNDYTLPELVKGKFDKGYLEDCNSEVSQLIKEEKESIAHNAQIKKDETFYY